MANVKSTSPYILDCLQLLASLMVKEAEKSSAAALENQNPIPCPRTCGCAFSPVGTLQSLHV